MASPNVQSFIQPIAQGNTPFLANNGNPGTVYNMPGTGSYKPPMSSANNQWALNPSGSAYANDQFWLTQPAANVGGGNPFFNNPGLTTVPGSTIIPAPPVVPPNTTTTTTTPTTGGVVNPDVYTGVSPGTGSSVGNVFNPGPLGTVVSNVGTSANNYTQGAGSSAGSGINWSGGVQGILGSLGSALGMKGGGGMDWQQALDLVLPGDLYNSETGRWNTGNAITSAASAINPLLGAIVQFAVDKGVSPAWVKQAIINDGLAQFDVDLSKNVADITARLQGTGTTTGIMENRTNQTFSDRGVGNNPFYGQFQNDLRSGIDETRATIDQLIGQYNFAPERDSRSGTSTGSGVVWSAEGGGNFAGGGERAWQNQLDAMKNQKPGSDVRIRQ